MQVFLCGADIVALGTANVLVIVDVEGVVIVVAVGEFGVVRRSAGQPATAVGRDRGCGVGDEPLALVAFAEANVRPTLYFLFI